MNDQPEFDVVALTPCITRPELHETTIPGYIKWFGDARVLWLFHIDPVHPELVSQTAETLRGLTSPYPNLEVDILLSRSACFWSAACRLVGRAAKELSRCRVGVLWIEDDWGLIQYGYGARAWRRLIMSSLLGWETSRHCPNLLQTVRAHVGDSQVPDDMWFVGLVDSINVSFNPGLWSKDLFVKGVVEPLSNVARASDPEKLCYPATAAQDIRLRVNGGFRDLGEAWRARSSLAKWDHRNLQGDQPVTYNRVCDDVVQFPRNVGGYIRASGFRGSTKYRAMRVSPAANGACLEVKVLGTPERSEVYAYPSGAGVEVWASPNIWLKPVSASTRRLAVRIGDMGLEIQAPREADEVTTRVVFTHQLGVIDLLLAVTQFVGYWMYRRWYGLVVDMIAHREFLASQRAAFRARRGRWARDTDKPVDLTATRN